MIKLSSQNLLIVFSFRETKLNIYCLKPAPTQIFHAQNPLLPNEENLTFSVAANRANSLAPSPHTETMGCEFKKVYYDTENSTIPRHKVWQKHNC